jgi:hypothetical protein
MKKNLSALIITGLISLGCLIAYLAATNDGDSTRCSPPPNEFYKLDLIGAWVAGWSGQTDTLIIKSDGTYKQIVRVEYLNKPPIDYESNWQPWHLEISTDNIPYLHLNGMRFCGMNPEISCNKRDGGRYFAGINGTGKSGIRNGSACILYIPSLSIRFREQLGLRQNGRRIISCCIHILV